ncbi:hypothetical protein [Rhodococcoides fascians]|uniref:hypothetical protein n=1 Tax=Rhodococcoides fascians TaxID=1828 RepID=UPI001E41F4A7|nr:hypothetical protein [Rhodococcus fascians]
MKIFNSIVTSAVAPATDARLMHVLGNSALFSASTGAAVRVAGAHQLAADAACAPAAVVPAAAAAEASAAQWFAAKASPAARRRRTAVVSVVESRYREKSR